MEVPGRQQATSGLKMGGNLSDPSPCTILEEVLAGKWEIVLLPTPSMCIYGVQLRTKTVYGKGQPFQDGKGWFVC